jgi:integrase
MMLGSAWENQQGFVFTNEFGHPLSAQTVYLKFKKVMEEMGLPDFRFHDLRHTFNVSGL